MPDFATRSSIEFVASKTLSAVALCLKEEPKGQQLHSGIGMLSTQVTNTPKFDVPSQTCPGAPFHAFGHGWANALACPCLGIPKHIPWHAQACALTFAGTHPGWQKQRHAKACGVGILRALCALLTSPGALCALLTSPGPNKAHRAPGDVNEAHRPPRECQKST